MRKVIFLFLLHALFQISSAQENLKEINILSVINKSDSTVFREKYEIDCQGRNICFITPVMNYLDIKNGKYRTPIHLSHTDWRRIISFINKIDFHKLDRKDGSDISDSHYEIEIVNSKNEILVYAVRNEEEVNNLKQIFWIIRQNFKQK